jgi:hypothetical protein
VLAHKPLEFLYQRFATYIEECRRQPRDDVLTGLATATFPDGSLPEVGDVMRIASNLFAAGQETTARLLGSALWLIGERPELQRLLREDRERIPRFVEETLRFESPIQGDFRLSRVPTTIGGVRIPAGTTVSSTARLTAFLASSRTPTSSASTVRTSASTSRSGSACTPVPARRSPAPRRASASSACSTAWATSGDGSRPGRCAPPTYMLRGLESLHLEFRPLG